MERLYVNILLFASLLSGLACTVEPAVPVSPKFKLWKQRITTEDSAKKIMNLVLNGAAKGQTYERLAELTDKFGSRISGSKNLENAIDYIMERLKKDGLDNVHSEPVMVPHWVRGEESATLLQPRLHPMAMLGLGSSVGTPPGGITAEAVVVRSFDELKKRGHEAVGKIVVYNQPFVSYGVTVAYRAQGASEASKVGAVASLIRSITPFSINSPHTGWQDYETNVRKIPTACITVEDAEMLDRMASRGEKIVINLKMNALTHPDSESRNTISEIKGSKYPDEIVMIGGHFDSWDVGQGAMDDGGGAIISWQALSVIRQLGLKPKRTIRAVLWTAEEPGSIGGKAYFEKHKVNQTKYSMVMESDIGTFKPLGLAFTGSDTAFKILQKQLMPLMAAINATQLVKGAGLPDGYFWMNISVPAASLVNQNDKYFYFHHSNGDTMTVQNSRHLDECAALWAVSAFVVADMDEMLPRK